MQIQNGYKDLIVWQKSMELVVLTYALLKGFPKEELFGLTSQLKRAVISIPSNIAEGSRRHTSKDRMHFYAMALGSAAEVETQIEIGKRLDFGEVSQYKTIENILTEVCKMLNKLAYPSI